ncbi:hypothetical protein LY78DRAFT_650941 [Colletotrichum sublineola]|nr:hypothetical protein LY78DRAFT_650941 [Colletotrichum sublineola]
MTDSSSLPAQSHEGSSDVASISETSINILQGTTVKTTSATAILQTPSEKEKKQRAGCVHESSRYAWKLIDKRGQKYDLCACVLPKFVLRCTRCNVQVCMMCGSQKGWIVRRSPRNPPTNLRLWDPAH